MARRTKLTPTVQTRLCDLLRKGLPRKQAARIAGIGESTLLGWLAKGREQNTGRFRALLVAVEAAEDELVEQAVTAVTSLLASADEKVRLNAAKFILSHRYPEEWSTRQEVRHQGADGGPVKIEGAVTVTPVITADVAATLSPEQLAAMAREFMSGRVSVTASGTVPLADMDARRCGRNPHPWSEE